MREYNLTEAIVEEMLGYLSEVWYANDIGPSAALDEIMEEYFASSNFTVEPGAITFYFSEEA